MSEPVPTTCMRCAVGCGHMQHGADRGYGLSGISGDPTHPVSQGLACGRGLRETSEPDGEWLTRPLIRKGGELVPTSWDAALGVVSDALAEARARAPDRVAVLGSGQQTNEAAYLLGKLARGAIGTRNYDANTTLCMASAVTAYYDAFGSDGPPPTYDDIPEADAHLVWGANPAVAHPVLFRWIRNTESELIVVDPVESETADHADTHVALEPGSDLALARAVLSHLVETDRIDQGFVDEHTEGFEELVDDLPDADEAAAGVSPEDCEALAAAFEERTLVYWGMGINQSTQGTASAGALIDLCLATGTMGEGAGPFSLTGQANSMGTRVCSSKGTWPGHREFEDPEHRETVAETWNVPVERLPDDPGPGPVGIGQAMAAGDVDVCYTVATNPVAGLPDAARAREAFEDTFLIAQDAFRSETTELADVVLPAATWGESEGTTTNMERTVSRVRAATDLPSGVWSDLDIIGAIGRELAPQVFDRPPIDPREVFDELRGLTYGTPADLSGIDYGRLETELAVRWPASADEEEDAGGYRYRTDDGWEFETPSGKARFSAGRHTPVPEPADEEYPLTLTTARKADEYNTGVRTRAGPPEPPIARLNPETLASAGTRVRDGLVVVRSRRGAVTARTEADERIPEGMVWLPIHHPAVNELTLPETDPRSDEPNYKQCAVGLLAPDAESERPRPVRAD